MLHIVTPCRNAADFIETTILSVITQAGDVDVSYHIQDACSTDGTIDKIARWKSRLDLGLFPVQCRSIDFTFSSVPDSGMYDAIATGFMRKEIDSTNFMTWINAGDQLMPGALSLINEIAARFDHEQVSWIGGAVNVIRNNVSMTQHDRITPTAVIAEGLCDGQFWDFVQQEGVFFRKWLWDEVDAPNMLRSFRYAGDWNLWRLFARCAEYIHAPYPLGAFQVSEDQMSRVFYDAYMEEIERCVSSEKREQVMRRFGQEGAVNRSVLQIRYADGGLSVTQKGALDSVDFYYARKFNVHPPCSRNATV